MSNRFKNRGLWLSFAALLFLVLQDSGILLDQERYSMYVNILSSIGYFLLGIGIYNNPETKNKWYAGDKDEEKDISQG